jgi:ribosomal protein L35
MLREQLQVARVPFFLIALKSLFFGAALFLGLSRHVFSRKDEPQTRNTRPAAFTLHMLLEQLQVARVPFFLIALKSLFFGAALFLGLSRHVFSRKDEPQTRNTRPAAFTLHMLREQLQVARVPFFLIALKSLFFGAALFLGLSRHVFSRKDEPRTRNTRPAAFTLHMLLEQLQVARVPFFLIALKKLFLGAALFLGLSRHVFSRKDEPQTRNTRPAAFTLHMLLEQLQVARVPFFLIALKKLFLGAALFLGLSRRVFSRKDEPRTRNTRPAAFTLHMLLEQLQVARVPFFLIALKSLFFGAALFLGLSRHVFSRKDEPQTRNTRPAAFTLHMLREQLRAPAYWTSCAHC